jgi:hypothetical protein
LSPCPCLIDAIVISAPQPPSLPLQYAYLVAIAANICPLHRTRPLLPSLLTLMLGAVLIKIKKLFFSKIQI